MAGSERYARLAELFAAARALPVDEREVYLRRECGGDAELLGESLELLDEDASGKGDAMDVALSDEEAFERSVQGAQLKAIGKYRILGICGSGGMGTVYEAEQDAPSRRVALKVIRAEATRPELLHRFRRETEILARLQHTGIAQIFEAGEFEQEGATRPFFAMEFVDGQPLTTFAERMELGVSARIELFLQVCDAIHYAHGQGVIHRDLKPDNIFVQETTDQGDGAVAGQPKILDFGVARVADADGKATLATGAGALLGSVVYMSPEQAAGDGDAVGPWSDLYSLGVVLFELLSGELPYHVRQRSLVDALHAIRHDEPTRLGSVAPNLRGDLETIVGKCLEKDVARRYSSVAAFADDLRRFQAVKPIAARPPTTWYQLQRFTQRNRALVGGAAATALALIVGAAFAVVFALESREYARSALASQEDSAREAYRANISAASALLETDPAHARRILSDVEESRRGWEHSYLSGALSGLVLEFGQVAPRPRGRNLNRAHGDMYLLAGGEEVLARRTSDEFGVWKVRTGQLLRTFRVPGEVDLYAVASDGSLMAVALISGKVIVGDPRAPGDWETWDDGSVAVDALAVAPATIPGGQAIAVDRPGSLRFGQPGAWQQHESPDARNYYSRALMEFSSDGSRLAWANSGLHVFDCESGELAMDPIQSDQGHWSLGFAPDGQRVAAGQFRREIRIFDPNTGGYDTELLGHNESVSGVAFGGPSRLVSFSDDGTLRVWDLDDARQIAIFDAPGTAKALFVDEDHVLSLTEGRFQLWQLGDRRCRELRGHRGHVFVPKFSPDGGLLATSAPWADLVIWDPLETVPLRSMPASRRVLFAFGPSDDELLTSQLRWSPHGERIPWVIGEPYVDASGTSGVIHALVGGTEFVVDGGRASAPKEGGMATHRNEHWIGLGAKPSRAHLDRAPVALGAADDGGRVLGQHPLLALGGLRSYEFSGAIAEWICFRGALKAEHANAVDEYLEARKEGSAASFPVLDGAPPLLAHFRAEEASMELDGDGHLLGWRGLNDPDVELAARGRPASSIGFVPAEPGRGPAHVRFKGGYGAHRWLEANLSQAAGAECLTVCWLGEFGQGGGQQTAYTIGEIKTPYGEFGAEEVRGKVGPYLSFSRDGELLADSWSQELGGAVTVRHRDTGLAAAQLEGVFWGVDFHPDSQTLACAGEDGNVHVFDAVTGATLSSFPAHSGSCFDLAFSPDGERLATCGNDNALRLWDARTFEPLLEFPGHRSYVRGVAWSPDSTMLVSACGDYVVRVWDAVPRRERYGQRLAARALEAEVESHVKELAAEHPGAEELRLAMRRQWAEAPEQRRAALKVLARMTQRAEDAAQSSDGR